MSVRITHEVFLQRINGELPHIEVLGEYVAAKKPVKFRCTIHDFVFEATPDGLKGKKCGCPKCAREASIRSRRKTNEQFLKELEIAAPNVIPLEEYVNAKQKILVKCKNCDHEWKSEPTSLLSGNECKKCAMKYVQNLRIKSQEEFIESVRKRNINFRFFDIVSQYTKDYEPITCHCKICDRDWTTMAHNIVSGSGCHYCNTSKGEIRVLEYLEANSIEYQWHKEFDDLTGIGGGLLSYDFYLPTYNLLIEYQGQFHDGTVPYQTKAQFEYQREHDRRKREYASDNRIELFEIWYKDFDAIDSILEQKLRG